MPTQRDLNIIEDQPPVKIWGEDFDDMESVKLFKGKFVMTDDGKLFAKLYPKTEWDNIEFFHDMLLEELGVKDAKSMDIKEVVTGGGKIEVELMDDFAECRLHGKSTIYGEYDPDAVDKKALVNEIREVFDLDDLPVTVIADFEE